MLGTAGWRTPDWISFNRFVLQLTGFARVETLTESPDMWGNTWKQKVFILSLRSENFFQCVGCSVATFNIIMAAESSLILIPTSDGNRWSRESVPHPNFSNLNSKNQGIGMTLSKISSAIKLKKKQNLELLESRISYLLLVFDFYLLLLFFCFFFLHSTVLCGIHVHAGAGKLQLHCVESKALESTLNSQMPRIEESILLRFSTPNSKNHLPQEILGWNRTAPVRYSVNNYALL